MVPITRQFVAPQLASSVAEVNDSSRIYDGTVPICFVSAALQPLRAGFDVDSILQKVGLSPVLLSNSQARVSAKQYGALWRLAASTLDDELLGQDSRRMKAGTFAMICHSALACTSLSQAIHRAAQFIDLVLDDISCQLQVGERETGLQLFEQGECHRIFGQECLLMLLHGMASWLVGRHIPITRAEFGYPEPPHSIEYRSIFTENSAFGFSHTTIFFESKYLKLRPMQTPHTLKQFLKSAPDDILTNYKNAASLGNRVHRRLRHSIGTAPLELDAMALAMGVTPATFRRRLNREGTSFRLIKQQLRRDLAIRQVCDLERNTTDIGWDLGYSERSAFERAFKKWTGVAPGEFRRRFSLG